MKSLVKYLLAGIALLSGSFVEVSAQDSTGEDKFVVNKKSAEYDYSTRMGTLTLESYVTGYVKQTRVAVPADICLVLDFSSSMKDNDKNKMLQKAAADFVDSLAASAKRNNVNHRIGVITFGTGAHIKTDFLSVQNNAANVATIKGYINSTCPAPNEGATRYELAMMLAKNMIDGGTQIIDIPQQTNSNSAKVNNIYTTTNLNPEVTLYVASDKCVEGTLQGIQSGSSAFVIFLTDGEPTGATNLGTFKLFNGQGSISTIDTPGKDGGGDGSRYGSSSSWSDDHMFGIANHAIRTCKYLKNSKNTSVYCIQLGTPSGDGKKYLCQDALTAMSSLYINAERYRQKYWGSITSGTTPFYQHITSLDQASISGAFTQISSSIEEVISAKYGEETLMKDFINNAYFSLPSSISADADPWSYIRVFDVKCIGVGADGKTREFEKTRNHEYSKTGTTSTDTIKIVVNRATSSHPNDEIIIYGFSYSNNWCGTYNGTPHGYKLEVEVPFEFNGGSTVPGEVMTNAEGSGIYPAEQDENGNIIYDPETGLPVYDDDPDEPYTPPTIKFCTLEIVREGLDRGESAIYEIKCNGVSVGRVSLNGTDDPSVSKTLYGLPGGNYTVTETNWNWAYNHKIEGGSSPNPCSITKKVDNPESKVTFTFSGEHKTGTGPEDMHNHDEEYKVNIIDVSTFPSPKAAPLRKEEDFLFE